MPVLWRQSVQAHRDAVREAVIEAVGTLAAEHGSAVTMSALAARAGVSRATLYRYFPDVTAAVYAWHQARVQEHLAELARVHQRISDPGPALQAVLEAYVTLSAHSEVGHARLLHDGDHGAGPRQQLTEFLEGAVREAAEAGAVRSDVAAAELAAFCVHALSAAPPSDPAARRRLLHVVLDGLRGTGRADGTPWT